MSEQFSNLDIRKTDSHQTKRVLSNGPEGMVLVLIDEKLIFNYFNNLVFLLKLILPQKTDVALLIVYV